MQTKIIATTAGKKTNFYNESTGRLARSSSKPFAGCAWAVVYCFDGRVVDHSFHRSHELAAKAASTRPSTNTEVVRCELLAADDPRIVVAKKSEATYIAYRKASMAAAKKLVKRLDARIATSSSGDMFYMSSGKVFRWTAICNNTHLTGSNFGASVSFSLNPGSEFLDAVERRCRKLSDSVNEHCDLDAKVRGIYSEGEANGDDFYSVTEPKALAAVVEHYNKK